MADGAALAERILEVNDAARRFRYAVDEHPLPARNVVATIDVSDLGDGRTRVRWGAEFDADGQAGDAVKEILAGVYSQGIAALEKHCAA